MDNFIWHKFPEEIPPKQDDSGYLTDDLLVILSHKNIDGDVIFYEPVVMRYYNCDIDIKKCCWVRDDIDVGERPIQYDSLDIVLWAEIPSFPNDFSK